MSATETSTLRLPGDQRALRRERFYRAGRLLRQTVEGLPLSIRDDDGDFYRYQFTLEATPDRHMVITDCLILSMATETGLDKDSTLGTLREVLATFARGENEIRYWRGGHEMTLVLWSPEQEQWI